MLSNIQILTLMEEAILTYIPTILRIRAGVALEFPYLDFNNDKIQSQYLQEISKNKDSIAILILDGPQVVGVSTGFPLEKGRREIQQPFFEKKHDVKDFFYLENSALFKKYHNRGIGHYFFDIREAHAKKLQYKKTCFYNVIPNKNHCNYQNRNPFLEFYWKKRGYMEHKDLVISTNVQQDQGYNFWIKNIK